MFTMFAEDLGRVFGTRTDIRSVRDSWGVGYTFGVRRADDPRCKDRLTKKEKLPAALEAGGRVMLKLGMAEFLGAKIDRSVRNGFRAPRKATHAEQALLTDGAEQDARVKMEELIEETAQEVNIQDLFRSSRDGDDVEALKPWIALHTIDWWEGVREAATGDPVPCTLPNRLNMLGWDGVLVLENDHDEETERGVHFLKRGEPLPEDLAQLVSSSRATFREFSGPHLNPTNQRPYEVPDGKPYGPDLVGTAIARMLLTEARSTKEYSQQQASEDAEVLGGTPAGGLALSTT